MRVEPIEKTYPTRGSTEKDPKSSQQRQQRQKKDEQSPFMQQYSRQLNDKVSTQISDEESIGPPQPVEPEDLLQLYEMEKLKSTLRKENIK